MSEEMTDGSVQLNGFFEALSRLFQGTLLNVPARKLFDVPDPPVAHLFENAGVTVVDGLILPRSAPATSRPAASVEQALMRNALALVELGESCVDPVLHRHHGTGMGSKYLGTMTVVFGDAALTSAMNDCR